jgi:hypothetical protein
LPAQAMHITVPDMWRPAFLLLRLQFLTWRNIAAARLRSSWRDRFILLGIGPLSCAYVLGLAWQKLVQWTPVLNAHRPSAIGVAIVGVALGGMAAGYRTAAVGMRAADAVWLATLPWEARSRHRAIVIGLAPGFTLSLALILALVMSIGAVTGIVPACLGGVCAACVFACGFIASACIALRLGRARGTRAIVASPKGPPIRLFARADRGAPRWAGIWALGSGARHPVRDSALLLCTLGLLGIAGSLATGTSFPGALCGAVGGHLVFVRCLRTQPLRAAALRVQPLPFWRAAWAVARLPLLLSLLWAILPDAAAFAVAPRNPAPVGGATALLLGLDGLFAVISFWLVEAPQNARLVFHAIVLGTLVQNFARFGITEFPLLGGVMAFLWRRGANGFRGRH